MNNHYKYVIIDSDRSKSIDENASYKINIAHGLKNVSRFCIKSFTTPNTMFNIFGDSSKLSWLEARQTNSTATSLTGKKHTIHIPPGYYTTTKLINTINDLFTQYDNKFANELKLVIQLNYDEDTFMTNVIVSQNDHKYFGIFHSQENTLWGNLGFNRTFHEPVELSGTHFIANMADDASFLIPTDVWDMYLNANPYYIKSTSSTIVANRTIYGTHAGVNENHAGIYITSKKLGQGSFECSKNDLTNYNDLQAIPSDVIQWINIDVPKFSHISYHSDTPMWISLDNKNINNFDIEIRDHKGQIFPKDAIQKFIMVIMFETVSEVEYTQDFIESYNKQGYRIGHPIR